MEKRGWCCNMLGRLDKYALAIGVHLARSHTNSKKKKGKRSSEDSGHHVLFVTPGRGSRVLRFSDRPTDVHGTCNPTRRACAHGEELDVSYFLLAPTVYQGLSGQSH
jgi:hypothetical protein